MKKISSLLTILFFIGQLLAQAPQKIGYQAIIRNESNHFVVNQPIGMRISILQGSPTGTLIYQETYSPNPQTNTNGLVTVDIGGGSATTGTFSLIDWSAGPYFLKTETDPTGGTNYTISGTSQLLSVPYAMYSKEAGSATESDPVFSAHLASGISNSDITNWNSTHWYEIMDMPLQFADGIDNDTWTQNTKNSAGYIPEGGSNLNKVWKTDATGNPSWGSLNVNEIPNLDWSKITSGKPSTLAGYGITDGMSVSHLSDGYEMSEKLTINNLTGRTALLLNSSSHTELRFKSGSSYIPTIFIGTTANGDMADDVMISFIDRNYGTPRLSFRVSPMSDVLNLLANGNVGIGNSNPSTKLDVSGVVSASGGFLPPRLTKAERDALSPVEGLMIYNLTTKKPNYYDGASWQTFDGTPID
jgi:hypothetical protein